MKTDSWGINASVGSIPHQGEAPHLRMISDLVKPTGKRGRGSIKIRVFDLLNFKKCLSRFAVYWASDLNGRPGRGRGCKEMVNFLGQSLFKPSIPGLVGGLIESKNHDSAGKAIQSMNDMDFS